MEIQEEKVMWIRKIGLGILIGVVPGKFKLPPDARIGDIIKTKSGYKQIIDIWGNGKFRLKSLEKKYYRQRKTRVKKRYN